MNKTILIIDGTALAYRSFYAFKNPLRTSTGIFTTVPFIFLNVLKKILENYKPDYIAVIFDLGKAEKRLSIYPEYKSTREKMPDEMAEQIPTLKELLSALDIKYFEIDGVEADDIIATVAERAEKHGFNVLILTSDKDMMQLVNDNIKIIRPAKGSDIEKIYDRNEVYKKFGVYPEHIIDYFAIIGDKSDNIPGINGIGPKTATKLFKQYTSLEQIIQNLEKITPQSLKEKFKKGIDKAILAKKLITLDKNINININFDELKIKQPEPQKAIPVLEKLEFNSFIKYFGLETQNTKFSFEFQIIDNKKTFDEFISLLDKTELVAIDVETNSLSPIDAQLIGISIAFEANKGYYLPFGHKNGTNLSPDVLSILNDKLSNKKFIGQNIKYDYIVLKNAGVHLNNIYFDTMIASYLLDPDQHHHSLDRLAKKFLNYTMQSYSNLMKETNKQYFDELDIKSAAFYSVEDVVCTFAIKEKLLPLIKQNNLYSLFKNIELPLIKVLANMEMNGIYVNLELLNSILNKFNKEITEIEKQIYNIVGYQFNINSTKQLGEILFNQMKLPTIRKTKTGFSTDVKVLKQLADKHILPKLILEYRQLSKLVSTYLSPLKDFISKKTGLIHPSFNQTIAATGRLSCSNPNLQNIPIRTERGKKIREIFQARTKKNILISADYSQIELRVLAHLSGDENLIESFKNATDFHRKTAALIYNIDEKDVSAEMRRHAKTINFGIIYGMSAFSLAKELKISRKEAELFINMYFIRFPKVKDFIDNTVKFAQENGYVTTMFNRKRYIPQIKSSNKNILENAKRMAINTPVQGSAADIIKKAMIDINNWIEKEKIPIKMVLQIHDELLFECEKKYFPEFKDKIKQIMEKTVTLRVPLIVDISTGDNWLSAH